MEGEDKPTEKGRKASKNLPDNSHHEYEDKSIEEQHGTMENGLRLRPAEEPDRCDEKAETAVFPTVTSSSKEYAEIAVEDSLSPRRRLIEFGALAPGPVLIEMNGNDIVPKKAGNDEDESDGGKVANGLDSF